MLNFREIVARKQIWLPIVVLAVLALGVLVGLADANSAGRKYQAKFRDNTSKLQALAGQVKAFKLSDLPSISDGHASKTTEQLYASRCGQLDDIVQSTQSAKTLDRLGWHPLGFLSSDYRQAQKQSKQLADTFAEFKWGVSEPLQALKQECVVDRGDLPQHIAQAAASKEYQSTLFHGSAMLKTSLTSYRVYTCHTTKGCRPDRLQTSQYAAFAAAYKHRWIDVTTAQLAVEKSYPKDYNYCGEPEAEPLCILNHQKNIQALKLYQSYYDALIAKKSDAQIEKIADSIGAYDKQWNKDYYALLKNTFPREDTTKPEYVKHKTTQLLQGREAKAQAAATKLARQLAAI